MKIAVLSDIHIDMNSNFVGEDLLPLLIQFLRTKKVELIIIAGDLSDYAADTVKRINEIEEKVGVNVLFIPGNHEVWLNQHTSSWDNYNIFKKHQSSLIERPYLINDDYVIIGEMGWFDYTLAAQSVHQDAILLQKTDWGDSKYTNWDMNDEELLTVMLKKIERQLKEYKNKKVIFVTHFVPYEQFLTSSDRYMDWDLYNAFMGSSKVGQLLDQFNNIEYVIFGHTHERYGIIEGFRNKKIVCNPVGYISKKSTELFVQELENSMIIIEI